MGLRHRPYANHPGPKPEPRSPKSEPQALSPRPSPFDVPAISSICHLPFAAPLPAVTISLALTFRSPSMFRARQRPTPQATPAPAPSQGRAACGPPAPQHDVRRRLRHRPTVPRVLLGTTLMCMAIASGAGCQSSDRTRGAVFDVVDPALVVTVPDRFAEDVVVRERYLAGYAEGMLRSAASTTS